MLWVVLMVQKGQMHLCSEPCHLMRYQYMRWKPRVKRHLSQRYGSISSRNDCGFLVSSASTLLHEVQYTLIVLPYDSLRPLLSRPNMAPFVCIAAGCYGGGVVASRA